MLFGGLTGRGVPRNCLVSDCLPDQLATATCNRSAIRGSEPTSLSKHVDDTIKEFQLRDSLGHKVGLLLFTCSPTPSGVGYSARYLVRAPMVRRHPSCVFP